MDTPPSVRSTVAAGSRSRGRHACSPTRTPWPTPFGVTPSGTASHGSTPHAWSSKSTSHAYSGPRCSRKADQARTVRPCGRLLNDSQPSAVKAAGASAISADHEVCRGRWIDGHFLIPEVLQSSLSDVGWVIDNLAAYMKGVAGVLENRIHVALGFDIAAGRSVFLDFVVRSSPFPVVAPAVVESNNWRLYTGYPAVDWLIVANLSVAVIHEKGNGVGIRTLGVARRRARTVRARLVCLERSLFQATRHRK